MLAGLGMLDSRLSIVHATHLTPADRVSSRHIRVSIAVEVARAKHRGHSVPTRSDVRRVIIGGDIVADSGRLCTPTAPRPEDLMDESRAALAGA